LNSDALTSATPYFWLFLTKETLLLTGGWAGWVVGGGWWLVRWLAGWLAGWLLVAGCWLLVRLPPHPPSLDVGGVRPPPPPPLLKFRRGAVPKALHILLTRR